MVGKLAVTRAGSLNAFPINRIKNQKTLMPLQERPSAISLIQFSVFGFLFSVNIINKINVLYYKFVTFDCETYISYLRIFIKWETCRLNYLLLSFFRQILSSRNHGGELIDLRFIEIDVIRVIGDMPGPL